MRAILKECYSILGPQVDGSVCTWPIYSFGYAEETMHVMAASKLSNLFCFVLPPFLSYSIFPLNLIFNVVMNVFFLPYFENLNLLILKLVLIILSGEA